LKAAAILPARLHSTRLARKMLLAETGRTLIEHSARNAIASGVFERVVVATDSREIAKALEAAGIEAVMTREDHTSGTDRVREAVRALGLDGFDVIVNVQGDEPELARADLVQLVGAFSDPKVEFATLCAPLENSADLASPQVVKVVRDAHGDALYFSRAPIPSSSHARKGSKTQGARARRHVGVYAFRPRALERFCELPIGALETAENLEQLRWLEAGGKLRVLDATAAPLGIDTRPEYDAFVARALARGGA
jgi:3-deoxy-manno-octulosonate cytidylyltransferase (CMP-KDO synthetase)